MLTLFFIVFIDLIGFGMIIPVLPFFATKLGVPEAWIVFLFGLYSFGQLVGAPLWGALSDRFGRRPVLLVTLAANVLANLALALAVNGWQLAGARIAAGLAAGNISTAYAYVTDITTETTRPRALGMLGAAFGLGFIVGPAIGGLLAGDGTDTGSLARVAHVAAILSGLAMLSTFAFLKESHGPEHRAHAALHPRSNRWQIVNRPALRELFAATMLLVAGVAMFQSTYLIWGAKALGVTPRVLGVIFGVTGVMSVAIQGGAIGPLTRRFGQAKLVRAGAVLCCVAMVLFFVSNTLPGTYLPLTLFAVGGALFVPSISAMVATHAGATERGAVLGVFQSASSLGRVVGPFLASAVVRGLGLKWPFMAGAVLTLGALGVLGLEHAGDEVRGAPPAPPVPAGD